MSTMLTWHTTTTDAHETEQLAAQLGSRLRGGEVVNLISDVGGGKTTFVRGLAKGMGSSDKVASPTFTISREYQAGRLKLYHFDFYRLHDGGIMVSELAEIVGDPEHVVVIEWADIIEHILPPDVVTIHIKNTGEDSREFTYGYPDTLAYILGDAS